MALTIEEQKIVSETMLQVNARRKELLKRAEVVLSSLKCVEYALQPDTKYLLCFESLLSDEQLQAVKTIFAGGGRNVFVICGGEEPKVFVLGDPEPVKFPTQRRFLDAINEEKEDV